MPSPTAVDGPISSASIARSITSRSTVGGTAIYKSVAKVREKAKQLAAHMLEASPDDIVFEGGKVVDDTGRQTSEEEAAALREKALLQEQVRREEQSALEAAASQTPDSGASSGETSADVPADVGIENQFKASVAEYFKSVVNQYFDQMQRGAPPGAGAPPPPAPAVPTTIR